MSDRDRTVAGMTALAVVELVVADMAAALAFYARLGLEAPPGSQTEDHVEVGLPGGLKLAFDTESVIKSIDPQWTPSTGGHRMALAFQCADPAEVDGVYTDLTAAGYDGHMAPFDAFWGQRYATVVDPDGNHIDLYASLG